MWCLLHNTVNAYPSVFLLFGICPKPWAWLDSRQGLAVLLHLCGSFPADLLLAQRCPTVSGTDSTCPCSAVNTTNGASATHETQPVCCCTMHTVVELPS